jgi:hypothetical protein
MSDNEAAGAAQGPRAAEQARQQDAGATTSLVLPSVPVDQLLDDHAVEFEECKRWANSDAGQAARMTNPAGFANVRAHAEAHLRAMTAALPGSHGVNDLGATTARIPRVNPVPRAELQRSSDAAAHVAPREFSPCGDVERDGPGDHWVTIDGNHVLIHEPQGRQNQTTLNFNGTRVDVTFYAAEFSNGQKGAVIDANPQGGCDNCRWAQTVSKTGEDAHETRTDRDPELGTQPLYPTGVHAGNDPANFSDKPRSTGPGTFTAVTTLGVADKANKTFKVIGSITWGYKIDKNGSVSGIAPGVATRAEQTASIAVLRRESPSWTIGP